MSHLTPPNKFLRHYPRDGSAKRQLSFWQRIHLDPWLLGLLLLNAMLGLTIVYSASVQDTGLLFKQTISFVGGFVLMVALAQVPPRVYQSFSLYLYGFGIILLLLVMLVGEVHMGARRWLHIPGVGSLQPSELLKIATPMMVAWFLARQSLPPRLKHIAMSLLFIGIPFLLIAKQPDLGTALLVLISGLFVLFLAGLSWWLIAAAVGLVSVVVPVAWQFLLHGYQKKRVMTLLDPESDALGAGWNIIQSKTAIGSGGWSGKGFLQGTQSHLHFLPEGHTDFIIAAYSEEFGFIGIAILMTIYLCMILRILQISLGSFHTYGRLVAGAFGLSFFVYVFVNAGMVSGILPIVGVPLPFMSYGGTAVISLMATFGIIMSIHTHQ